jgi:hypothetical protein
MQEDKLNEAQMILFQIARKTSSDHTEAKVNSNASLRKQLTAKILAEAKSSHPEITQETWAEASARLAERG